MKVALVGPRDVRAGEVGRVLDQLSDQDELVVTGALRGLVDVLLKRRPRSRRPRVTVEFMEQGRYSPDEARNRLAMRLVHAAVPPHEVVIVGDLEGEFVDALIQQAEKVPRPIPVVSGEDFVRERTEA